jgi:hypothetical protein
MLMGTKTGRMSAKKPNFSNPPRTCRPERPTQCCEFFRPKIALLFTIPEIMRPSKKALLEPDFDELLKRVWKEQREKNFNNWKRQQARLPSCPVHHHLEIEETKTEDEWTRALWWTCKGVDEPSMSYRGYELL